MNFDQLLNQFIGSGDSLPGKSSSQGRESQSGLSDISRSLPTGLAGGAAAGGIVALLMSNKKAKKFAGKAAKYGGAALLGGVALKAYQNWQRQPTMATHSPDQIHIKSKTHHAFHQEALSGQSAGEPFEMTLIRAMIAASRADGHIDAEEQQRIFTAIDKMGLSVEHKGVIFDCLQQDISVQQLASDIHNDEQKMEVYLASCLVTDMSHSAERAHMDALARALQLPDELCRELEKQASMTYNELA